MLYNLSTGSYCRQESPTGSLVSLSDLVATNDVSRPSSSLSSLVAANTTTNSRKIDRSELISYSTMPKSQSTNNSHSRILDKNEITGSKRDLYNYASSETLTSVGSFRQSTQSVASSSSSMGTTPMIFNSFADAEMLKSRNLPRWFLF